eukprot:1029229-Pelagomonas_calceolata.AAC.3
MDVTAPSFTMRLNDVVNCSPPAWKAHCVRLLVHSRTVLFAAHSNTVLALSVLAAHSRTVLVCSALLHCTHGQQMSMLIYFRIYY